MDNSLKLIEDKADFYRSGIPEALKIRNLISTCQRIFVTTSKKIDLYLVGDKDVYRLDIFGSKNMISRLMYYPKQQLLELYDGKDVSIPLFVWKSKKCIQKNIPICLETLKVESLFLPILSVI